MPISDKVIELETKKTGRNVLFIVLIAVLAAASVVFAVLWVLKESAAPPPSIEAISVASTDMSETQAEEGSAFKKYVVVASQEYSVTFNVVLKGDTAETEINSLLNIATEPAGMVRVSASSMPSPTQYEVKFVVSADAVREFRLVATSEYTNTVSQSVDMVLSSNSYVSYFDLTQNADGQKMLYNNAGGAEVAVLESATPSGMSANEKLYKVKESLSYFEDPLSDRNIYYRLSFDQLGNEGINGVREKISRADVGDGKHFDEVQVYYAQGAYDENATYTPIGGSSTGAGNLRVYLLDGYQYFRNGLQFNARSEGTTTLKLVANAYNGAPEQYVIYVEISFRSSNTLGKITEIRLYDPYTGKPSEDNVLNLYAGDFFGSTVFRLPDCIKTIRGKDDSGKEIEEDSVWGAGNLHGFVTENHDNLLAADGKELPNGQELRMISRFGVGTAQITVEDTDPDGFKVSLSITVNVHVPVQKIMIDTKTATADGRELQYTLSDYAGNTITQPVAFRTNTLTGVTNIAERKNPVHTEFSVAYDTAPQSVAADDDTNVKKFQAPIFDKDGKLTNADRTIYLKGLDSRGIYNAAATYGATIESEWSFASQFVFEIGKDVPTGSYDVALRLTPQSLTASDRGNTPGDPILLRFTVDVTRLAKTLGVQQPSYADEDAHTELQAGQKSATGMTATLTLGVGTGKYDADAHAYFTQFGLNDLLAYFTEETELTDAATRNVNYAQLHVAVANGRSVSDIFSAENADALLKTPASAKFKVPQEYDATVYLLHITIGNAATGEFTLDLTVEYKIPVGGVTISSERADRVYYKSDLSTLVGEEYGSDTVFNNLQNDGVRVLSLQNNAITDTSHIKHPDRLHIDLAVMVNSAAYLLPKKTVAGHIYFFPRGFDTKDVSTESAARKDALFYTTDISAVETTPWKYFELVLNKDLYAASVESNSGYDWQNIRVYYTYGEDILTTLESGAVEVREENNAFVARADYTFVREFDELQIYNSERVRIDTAAKGTDANGMKNDVFEPGIEISSGGNFIIYVVGVIYPHGKTDITPYYVANNVTSDGPVYSCRIVRHAFALGEEDEDMTVSAYGGSPFGHYTATCNGEAANRVLAFSTVSNNIWRSQVYVALRVTNMKTKIADVELFSDAARSKKLSQDDVLLLCTNGADNRTVTIYYKVTYEKYGANDTFLDDFVANFDNSYLERVTNTDLTGFFTTKPTALAMSTPEDATARAEGLSVHDGVFTVNGFITLQPTSGAKNTARTTFGVDNNNKINIGVGIRITTLVENPRFNVTDSRNESVEIVVDETDYAEFKFDVSKGTQNAYELALSFNGDADVSNFSYHAQIVDGAGNPNVDVVTRTGGRFFDENGAAVDETKIDGRRIGGYRLFFENTVVKNFVLTITITETIRVGETTYFTQTYTFRLRYTLQASVADIELKRNSDGVTLTNNGSLSFVEGQTANAQWQVLLLANKKDASLSDPTRPMYVQLPVDVKTSDAGVATASYASPVDSAPGVLTVVPARAGTATITLTSDGHTFTFTVHVTRPALTVSLDGGQTMYDIFRDDSVGFTVSYENGSDNALPSDLTVLLDGAQAGGAFALQSGANGRYTLSIDKSALAAADLTTHTLTVRATINGVACTAEKEFTLTAGYTPALALTRTDGATVTDDTVLLADVDKYEIALTNPPSGFANNAVRVSWSVSGFAYTEDGNTVALTAFTGNISAGGSVTVTVTVLGKTFTYTLPVRVLSAPQISVTPPTDASGLGTYVVSVTDDIAFTAAHSVVAGSDLISVTKSQDGASFTVSANANTAGGTAVVNIVVTVTDARFVGTPYAAPKTFSYAVTVTGETKPTNDALTVTKTDSASGGTLSASVTGYTPVSVSFAVTAGGDYIRLSSDGSYTFVKDTQGAHTAIVTVIAVVHSDVYGDVLLTKTVEIAVPQKGEMPALVTSDVRLSAYTWVGDRASGTLSVDSVALSARGIEVLYFATEDATLTLSAGGDLSFAIDDSARTATVKVYYRIVSGDYADDEIRSLSYTLQIPARPSVYTSRTNNTFEVGMSGLNVADCEITVQIADADKEYITVTREPTANGYLFTYTFEKFDEQREIQLRFVTTIQSGALAGYAVSPCVETVTLTPINVELSLQTGSAARIVVSGAPSEWTYEYAVQDESGMTSSELQVASNGTFSGAATAANGTYTVEVTVRGMGAYSKFVTTKTQKIEVLDGEIKLPTENVGR